MIDELKKSYEVRSNSSLELLTIRHYTEDILADYTLDRKILLEQKTRNTVQLVVEAKDG
jgi:aspartate kinase